MKMYKNISMTPVGKTIDNRCVWKIIVDGKEVHQPLLSLSKFEYGISGTTTASSTVLPP